MKMFVMIKLLVWSFVIRGLDADREISWDWEGFKNENDSYEFLLAIPLQDFLSQFFGCLLYWQFNLHKLIFRTIRFYWMGSDRNYPIDLIFIFKTFFYDLCDSTTPAPTVDCGNNISQHWCHQCGMDSDCQGECHWMEESQVCVHDDGRDDNTFISALAFKYYFRVRYTSHLQCSL